MASARTICRSPGLTTGVVDAPAEWGAQQQEREDVKRAEDFAMDVVRECGGRCMDERLEPSRARD
eukprot:9606356-Lingulodinium_polyedra.AAC.1